MAFAKATKAQQVTLRDATHKLAMLAQRGAVGSGIPADVGPLIDSQITAVEAIIATIKAAA